MTRQAAAKALARRTFGGYCGDSEFLQMDWASLKRWCKGEIVVSIGAGDLDNTLAGCLRYAMAWNDYQGALTDLMAKKG